MHWTIERLKNARESEDKVEFKRAELGNFAYDGGARSKPAERRRCILGYVTALCNENGGSLVLGMEDKHPHKVVGTTQCMNALGDLEAAIYRDVRIRPEVYELFENEETKSGRVVVIDVPPRPIGQVFKFEDVPLMRVGEELTPMSESQYRRIVEEQDPDFSERICEGITIDDLDDEARKVMKEKYAKKQNNQMFLTLPKERILSDLNLTVEGQVTYGALLLVGKAEIIARELPQAEIRVEYRNSFGKIPFDNRIAYMKPFFLMIDELWHDINLRNGSFPVNEGSYIFNVPYFNEEVIRESINNAVAHRDYRLQSETVIKLYPQQMTIVNAGGFPHGVTIENILTVPSTPRNRLLADVLAKTGIVERSGQGVDKIFYDTLSEGKKEPDYSKSDDFHVELTLSSVMHDQGFAIFIDSVQKGLPDEQKLSVHEIMTLAKIRDGENPARLDKSVVRNLLDRKLIEKRGKTKGTNYILCRSYFEYAGDIAAYARKSDWDENQMRMMVFSHLAKYQSAKMGDFVSLFEGHLNRRQVRDNILKMVKSKALSITGTGSGTRYSISEDFKKGSEFLGEIFDLGLAEFNRRHVIGNVQKMMPNGG